MAAAWRSKLAVADAAAAGVVLVMAGAGDCVPDAGPWLPRLPPWRGHADDVTVDAPSQLSVPLVPSQQHSAHGSPSSPSHGDALQSRHSEELSASTCTRL